MRKKNPIVKLKEEIWENCRRIIRARDGFKCFTCGAKNLKGSNRQCGHMVPAHISKHLRYSLFNLYIQCGVCNVRLGGNSAIGLYKMIQIHGIEKIDAFFEDLWWNKVKVDLAFYTKMLEELKKV